MGGHEYLAGFAIGLAKLISNCLRAAGASNLDYPFYGKVTFLDLAGALCVLLGTFILAGTVKYFLSRKAKQAREDAKEIKHHFIQLSDRPFYLFIWSSAFYVAFIPVLLKLPDEWKPIARFYDKAFDLSLFVALIWFFVRMIRILEARLNVWANRTKSKLDDLLVPLLGKCLRMIVPVIGIILAIPVLKLPAEYSDIIEKGTGILIIGTIAWILFEAVNAGQNVLLLEHDIQVADNLRARKIHTQVKLLGKAIHVVIALCTTASILMLFQQVRHVGASLLASAGIAGIIAGIAAQQTLANLFAGFQIAFAQPLRQGDVVVVEGAWGTIEEITLTFVVVHVWDDTRLVLPLSYFITKPFQNWTRVSSQILGSVFVWVDYTFPVEEGRKALKSIIENNPLWDKRFWNLQVSDASEKTMQLRVLATSADSSKSWDLRCKIREDFIAFIQQKHPQNLAQLRTKVDFPTGKIENNVDAKISDTRRPTST
jgi:small-conductance mechanosensitive channel